MNQTLPWEVKLRPLSVLKTSIHDGKGQNEGDGEGEAAQGRHESVRVVRALQDKTIKGQPNGGYCAHILMK